MERSAKKKRICGKYCVAGGPGQLSCKNNSLTEGISMHTFPSSEVLRSQWTKFVRKHRQCFKPSKTSVLCSMHFKPECFTRRLDLTADVIELTACRRLVQGSIPTIDCAAKPVVSVTCTQNLTDRNRRKTSSDSSDSEEVEEAVEEEEPEEDCADLYTYETLDDSSEDPDWTMMEEETEETETFEQYNTSVTADDIAQEEPKFLVFYTMLMNLFTMFCFRCKTGKPRVEMKKNGTKAYDKLDLILNNTQILNDIKRLSPFAQTSSLEGFHATLNHWHPKMLSLS
ncbi:hypothetical protein QZH41_020456 [Actinostola sp. cb2023]|nr:hypothetical protein QZH41_020456 [Actinostola sp. cb2023]